MPVVTIPPSAVSAIVAKIQEGNMDPNSKAGKPVDPAKSRDDLRAQEELKVKLQDQNLAMAALKGSNMLDILKADVDPSTGKPFLASDATTFTIADVKRYIEKMPLQMVDGKAVSTLSTKLKLSGQTSGEFKFINRNSSYAEIDLVRGISSAASGNSLVSFSRQAMQAYLAANQSPKAGAPAAAPKEEPAKPAYTAYAPADKSELFAKKGDKALSEEEKAAYQKSFTDAGLAASSALKDYQKSGLAVYAAQFGAQSPELLAANKAVQDSLLALNNSEKNLSDKITGHGEASKNYMNGVATSLETLAKSEELKLLDSKLTASGAKSYEARLNELAAAIRGGDSSKIAEVVKLEEDLKKAVVAAKPTGQFTEAQRSDYIKLGTAFNAFSPKLGLAVSPDSDLAKAERSAMSEAQGAAADLLTKRTEFINVVKAQGVNAEAAKAALAQKSEVAKRAFKTGVFDENTGTFSMHVAPNEATAGFFNSANTEKFANSALITLDRLKTFAQKSGSAALGGAIANGEKTDWKAFDKAINQEIKDKKLNREAASELKAAAKLAKMMFEVKSFTFLEEKLDASGKPIVDAKGKPQYTEIKQSLTEMEYTALYYHFVRNPKDGAGVMEAGHWHEKNFSARQGKTNQRQQAVKVNFKENAFGPDVLSADLANIEAIKPGNMRWLAGVVENQVKMTTGRTQKPTLWNAPPAEALQYNTIPTVIQGMSLASSLGIAPTSGFLGTTFTAARIGSMASSISGLSGAEGFLGALALELLAPGSLDTITRMTTIRLGTRRGGGGSGSGNGSGSGY